MSLNGICRIFDLKMPWLVNFINFIINDLPEDLNAQVTCHEKNELGVPKIKGDEQCSLVENKKNDQWLWLVFHKKSRQVLVMQVGPRYKKPLSFFLQIYLNH